MDEIATEAFDTYDSGYLMKVPRAMMEQLDLKVLW
jgi:hypothetical protein